MTGSLAAVLVDPVLVTWKALGAPAPVATSGPVARCGRCSQEQSLQLLREILSSNFTGWDQVNPSSQGLCAACAWSFTEPLLRTTPIVITRTSADWSSAEDLLKILVKPLPAGVAISMPIRGQKHLLPSAEWGCVISDGGVLPWGGGPAALLSTMLRARKAGATKSDFDNESPSAEVIVAAGTVSFEWWQTLKRWRGSPHFDVARSLAGKASVE